MERADKVLVAVLAIVVFIVVGGFLTADGAGTRGQWAGSLGSFIASVVALYIAHRSGVEQRNILNERDRREDAAREAAREAAKWEKAVALGTELWVDVDQVDLDLPLTLLTPERERGYQVRINALMATAEHGDDQDFSDYCEFLCKGLWQPLAALNFPDEDHEAILVSLGKRQEYVSVLNAVADMKVIDPNVPLGELEPAQFLQSSNIGLDWP